MACIPNISVTTSAQIFKTSASANTPSVQHPGDGLPKTKSWAIYNTSDSAWLFGTISKGATPREPDTTAVPGDADHRTAFDFVVPPNSVERFYGQTSKEVYAWNLKGSAALTAHIVYELNA